MRSTADCSVWDASTAKVCIVTQTNTGRGMLTAALLAQRSSAVHASTVRRYAHSAGGPQSFNATEWSLLHGKLASCSHGSATNDGHCATWNAYDRSYSLYSTSCIVHDGIPCPLIRQVINQSSIALKAVYIK